MRKQICFPTLIVTVSIGLSCNSTKKGYQKARTPVSTSAAKSIMKTDYYIEDKRNSECYGLHSRPGCDLPLKTQAYLCLQLCVCPDSLKKKTNPFPHWSIHSLQSEMHAQLEQPGLCHIRLRPETHSETFLILISIKSDRSYRAGWILNNCIHSL